MKRDKFAMLGMVLVMAMLWVSPVAAQWVPKRADVGGSAIPRTPWGDPDLQGLWNNSTTTPLERLTAEEQAQSRRAQQPVIEATSGTGAGWLEQAGRINRESLVIEPADGRIRMAQQALKRGRPIKIIAGEVGYGSEVALSRAFKAYTGISPRQWREAQAATL